MFIATTWMLMGSSNDFGAMRRELHMADRAVVVAGAGAGIGVWGGVGRCGNGQVNVCNMNHLVFEAC